VDESAQPYYMLTMMRLLLLLSAFLTAMVGVGAPVAAATRPASEISATVGVCSERQVPAAASTAPSNLAACGRTDIGSLAVALAPTRSAPLYLQRLRV
jgi:hypothetical protein